MKLFGTKTWPKGLELGLRRLHFVQRRASVEGSGSCRRLGLAAGPTPSVWIIHEVKQEGRVSPGLQLKRQEACEFAAWAYETRDELRAELARTQYTCCF